MLIGAAGFSPMIFAYSLNTSSWIDGEVTMQVDLEASNPAGSNPPNIVVNGPSTAALQAAYLEAMTIWNNTSTFSFSADTQSGAVDPCPQPSAGGGNGVKFASVDCDGAFGSTTLAVQQSWSSSGVRIQTGTVFNNTKQWDIYSGSYTGVAEFRRVAVHELGHGLGLGHENGVSAIMNSSIGNVEVPQADDLLGAAQFYDTDNDTIGLVLDNCPDTPNLDQSNIDGDAFGDECDQDIDGDGVWNSQGQDVENDPAGSTGSFYYVGPDNASYSYAAQSFVSSIDGDLTSVTLPVYCLNGMLTLSVRSANGDPNPGAAIATQVFTAANGLPDSFTGAHQFSFSSPATLSAGNQYAVIVEAQNDCRWFRSAGSYSGGHGYYSSNNVNWFSFAFDLGFSTQLDPTTVDNCPLDINPLQADTDNDGIGDACDVLDSDNDGVEDALDNCPNDANADQADNDLDFQGDVCDLDDDNDTLSDFDELNVYFTDPLLADTDGDGISDGDEVAAGTNPLIPDLEIPSAPAPFILLQLSALTLLGWYSLKRRRH